MPKPVLMLSFLLPFALLALGVSDARPVDQAPELAVPCAEAPAEQPTLPAEPNNPTVQVCHVTGGENGSRHAITISLSALAAHLAHGDTVGDCIPDCSDATDSNDCYFASLEMEPPYYCYWDAPTQTCVRGGG